MTTSTLALKHLVLLGAGHAHVQVLHGLAHSRPADLMVTVVAPYPRQMYSGMVPGFVAGHYALDDCAIALPRLLERAGARFVQAHAVGLDTDNRTVFLDDDSTLDFEWLSINTGPVLDRTWLDRHLPGATEHALLVRPIERFAMLWPRVVELAGERPLHVAVVGGGAAGIELSMAMNHALTGPGTMPQSHVTLVCGPDEPGAAYPEAVRRRIARALKSHGITVLRDSCTGFAAGEVLLAGGARLHCDAPVLAIGAQAPGWLADSGLALDAQGFVAVNACQQSTSHANVFAAGDVASRVDRPHPRSGVYAVRAGPPLLANLRATAAGQALTPYRPQTRTLNLLSCGARTAIGAWGPLSFEGGWVWRWKDRIDRRFMRPYSS